MTIAYWCFDIATPCIAAVGSARVRRRAGKLFDLDLDVPVVARWAPVVWFEVQLPVAADQLRRLDLDVGQALPAAVAKAQVALPAVVHSHPAGLLTGQQL